MRQSPSSASSSQKWSEPIIVLGKGVPAYSATYGCLVYCVAGIGENACWLRLFPLFAEKVISSIQFVEKFDVIRVVYREKRPEQIRPESRKVYPEYVEKISSVNEEAKRVEILSQHTEVGTFLHDDSWRGKKTLGMIQAVGPLFLVDHGTPKVRFRCSDVCTGHVCEVGELKRFDGVGRSIPEGTETLEHKLAIYRNKALRFVMGTDSQHPHRWLLISMHIMETS